MPLFLTTCHTVYCLGELLLISSYKTFRCSLSLSLFTLSLSLFTLSLSLFLSRSLSLSLFSLSLSNNKTTSFDHHFFYIFCFDQLNFNDSLTNLIKNEWPLPFSILKTQLHTHICWDHNNFHVKVNPLLYTNWRNGCFFVTFKTSEINFY